MQSRPDLGRGKLSGVEPWKQLNFPLVLVPSSWVFSHFPRQTQPAIEEAPTEVLPTHQRLLWRWEERAASSRAAG